MILPRLLSYIVLSMPFACTLGADESGGFKPLFNGKDLSGWVPCNVAADTFSVKDGMIVTTGQPIGFMRTERMYENFVIELDWRHLKEAGNSGLFIWGEGLPAPGVPYARGIEVQILDLGYAKNDGNSRWFTTHGDIFPIWGATMTPTGKVAPQGVRSFPAEELTLPSPQWNHYRVECKDGEIRLSVNGKEVTTGKECTPRKGFICLESEGTECHFRNIRIKELPSTNASPEQTARGYEGFVPLFNGKDMGGWRSSNELAWSSDGVAFTAKSSEEASASPLVSEKEFGDCVLCIDWRSKEQIPADRPLIKIRNLPVVASASANKPGEWNRLFITLDGKTASVEQNGQVIRKDLDLTGMPEQGAITLEHAGDGLEFRNLFLKELR
ncbi:3-keto-disaccharide hydrolase [Luteolibacter luteus]|uniref:DUF1080 domain-containing protein n=1 Tax=Luteolibacter luteus TaxID=2728835 RepID=A0A858RQX8_9BACT|nr:DUF1080 domain-containing protein [Luteolibacter luteus]QJE98798.1 DUF1080 domain-containing protein [Luteolibacter luteus]